MSKKSYRVPDGVATKVVSILENEGIAQHTAVSAHELELKYFKLTGKTLKDDMQCGGCNENWWILLRSLKQVHSMQVGNKPDICSVLFYITQPFTFEQQKLETLVKSYFTKSNGTISSIAEQYRPSAKYESLAQHVADVYDGISIKDLLLKVVRARVDKSNSNLHTYSLFSPSPKKAERMQEISLSRKAIFQPRYFPQEEQLEKDYSMEVVDEPSSSIRSYRCPDNVRAEILDILKHTTKDRPMSAMLVANYYAQRNHFQLKVAMNCVSQSKPWYVLLCKLGGGIKVKPIAGSATSRNASIYLSNKPKEPRHSRTEAQLNLIRDVKLLLNGASFQQEFTSQDVEDRYSILHGLVNGSLADNVMRHFDSMTVEDFLFKIIKVGETDDMQQSSLLGKRPRLLSLHNASKRAARRHEYNDNSHNQDSQDRNHDSNQQHKPVPEFSPIPVKQSKVTFAPPPSAVFDEADNDYFALDADASFSPIDKEVAAVDNSDEMEVDYEENYDELPTQAQQERKAKQLKEKQVIASLSDLIKSVKHKPFDKTVGSLFNTFLLDHFQFFTDESLIVLLSYCGEGGQDDTMPAAVKWIKLRSFERCLQESSIATQPLTVDSLRKLFHIMHRKLCYGGLRKENDLLTVFLRMLKERLEHHLAMPEVTVFDTETLSECFYKLRYVPYSIDYSALVDVLSRFAALMPTKFNREQLAKVIYGLKSTDTYDESISTVLSRITNITEITPIMKTSATEAINDQDILHQCKYLGKGLQRMMQSAARGSLSDKDTSSVTSSSVASVSITSSSTLAATKIVSDYSIMKPLLFLISSCWTNGIETLLTRSSIPKDDDLVAFLFQSLKDQGLAIRLYSEFRRLLVTFVRYSRGRSVVMTSSSKDDNMKTLENILAFIASMKNYDSNIPEVRELLSYFTKELNEHTRLITDREAFYKRAVSHGYGPLQLRRALCGLRSDCIAVRYFIIALCPFLEQTPEQRAALHSGNTIKPMSSLIGLAGLGVHLQQALTNPASQVKPVMEDYEDQFIYDFLLSVIDEQFSSLSVVDPEFIVSIAPALKVAEEVVFERIATLLVTSIASNIPSLLLKGEAMIIAMSAVIHALLEGDNLVSDHGERTLSESYRSLLALCFLFLKNTTDGGVMTSALTLEAFRTTLNLTMHCCNHVCLLPTSDAYSVLTSCIQNLISTIRLAGLEKKTQLAIELLNTVCNNKERGSSSVLWLQWYNPITEMAFLTAFNIFFRHVQAFTASTDETLLSQARSVFDTLIYSKVVQAFMVGNEQQSKLFLDRLVGSIACIFYPIKVERDLMLLSCLLQWSSVVQTESSAHDYIRSTIGSLVKQFLEIQSIHLLMNLLKTNRISKEALQQWRDNLSNNIANKQTKESLLNDINAQRIAVLQGLMQSGRVESLLTHMLPMLIPNNEVDQKFASHAIILAGLLLAIAWTNPPLSPSNGNSSHISSPDSCLLLYYQAIRQMLLPVILDEIVTGNDPDASKVLHAVKHIIAEIEDNLFADVIMKRIESMMNGDQYLDSRNLSYLYEGVMSTFVSHRRLRTRSDAKDKLGTLLNNVYLRGKGVISYPQYNAQALVSTAAVPSWWCTAIEDETVLPYVGNALCSAASENTPSLTAQYAWATFTDHVLVSSLPALFSFDYVAENEGKLAIQLARLNIAINSQASDHKAGFLVSPGLLKIAQHRMIDQDNEMADESNSLARLKLLVDIIPTASTVQAPLLHQQKVLDEDAVLQCRIFNGCIRVLVFVSTNPNIAEEEGEESNWSHLTLIKSRTKRMLLMLLKCLEL